MTEILTYDPNLLSGTISLYGCGTNDILKMKDFIKYLQTDMGAMSDKDWKRRVQAMAYNLLNNLES